MLNILFAARTERWEHYRQPINAALAQAGISATLAMSHPPEAVDYIVYAPNSDVQDFAPFTRLKAVLNLWAGVEEIVGNASLQVPLCRMSDPGLTQGMTEWVAGHVLRHHLGMDRYVHGIKGWERHVPPLAGERRVSILGLGALGTASATALAGLGFDVAGWSRTPKTLAGVTTFHGAQGLDAALSRAEILVTLLPDTAVTQNILNARTMSLLPRGAVIVNPGRGPLIDDDALLAALDTGQIAHATLDVFRVEPLPAAHPFRSHRGVTVTPHIAAETRAVTSAPVIAENIRRCEAGEPLLHVVDRALGY